MKPRRRAKVKAATARRESWRLQARMLADEREADAIVRQRAAWRAYAPAQWPDAAQRAAARIEDGQARLWTAAGDRAERRTEEAA